VLQLLINAAAGRETIIKKLLHSNSGTDSSSIGEYSIYNYTHCH
jgi:hypothetical protein